MNDKGFANDAPEPAPAWASQDRDDDGRFTEHLDLLGHTVSWFDADDLV